MISHYGLQCNEKKNKYRYYWVAMGFLLLGYLLIPAFDDDALVYPAWLAFVRVMISIIALGIGRPWKDKGCRLLVLLLLYQIIRVVIKDPNQLFALGTSSSLLNAIWVVIGCYSFARIIKLPVLKKLFHCFILLWTIGTIVHCSVALYAVWTNRQIVNFGGHNYWGLHSWYYRLKIGYSYPTTAGSFLSVSGVLALYALITEDSLKQIKIIYGFSYILIIITLSLTDARTSFISLSVGVGCLVGAVIKHRMESRGYIRGKKGWTDKKTNLVACSVSIISIIVSFIITLFIITKAAPAFVKIRSGQGIVITTAKAEEQEKIIVDSRGFSSANVLSGRGELWRNVFKYVIEEPQRLMFGESIDDPMGGINQRIGESMGHTHNMILQILLESGLVGLLLVFIFALYTAKNVLRIISSKTLPLWIKLIPAIPVSVLVGDLAECFGWFAEWKGPALPFLFVACGIINVIGNKQNDNPEDTNGIHQLCSE